MHMIFSVCKIRQFTETTESLQDEIIVFVNKIVKIIHEVAKRWDGQPAKNYGEKYLLIWKLPTSTERDGYQAAIEQNKQLALAARSKEDTAGPNEERFNMTGKVPDVNGLLLGEENN